MLYFIATPIGNLKEITIRAIETLKSVDCIYAENPRHSLALLNAYEISKPVFEYQKHSEKAVSDEIIKKMQEGKVIAVVSDAGTPLISDPGSILVRKLIKNDLSYTLISGPCAMINALVLSGLNTQHFCMVGFLPHKKSDRIELIKRFVNVQATLVFYMPVHDLKADMEFLFKYLGARKIALVREISKKFESVTRGCLGEPLEIIQKGEFVLVVEGAISDSLSDGQAIEITPDIIKKKLQSLIDGGVDKKDAIKLVALELGLKKSAVYSESVDI
ncbi:MAG: 16S rRNA (cytidine(1402)-2'-O)-methyltransferase [Firmicutes bacterium]|nr:16S rRNA (cytidine(1402)-2'-O)-methyltransferase [Bacillota bacterium]